ncbi:MAG: Crp/Fnr family transcriptional regulator [Spirochaetaceae bacterium]|nr:MAG: Crp/Fnr family transcriptional regulator [Spirochaetaceae bacterium]
MVRPDELHSNSSPVSSTGRRNSLVTRLRLCRPFDTAEAHELDVVLSRHRWSLTSYHRNAIIAFRGDRYERLLVLLRGAARSEMNSYHGKRYAPAEHAAPCLLAPAFLFATENSLPVSIISTSDSQLLRLPRAAVLELCHIRPEFLESLMSDISDRLAALAEKLRLSRLATIRERVADYLLHLSELRGTRTMELPHTRQELAEIMGVTRPALSRVFGELADKGVIVYDRGDVQIIDLDSLLELVPE